LLRETPETKPQRGFVPQTTKLFLRRKNFADTSARIPDMSAEVPDTSAKPPDMSAEVPDTSAKPPDTLARIPDTLAKPLDMSAKVSDMSAKIPDTAAKPLFTKTERRTIMNYRMNANISRWRI
jgi:hypothetical protein